MRPILLFVAVALAASGCIASQVTPVAPSSTQLDDVYAGLGDPLILGHDHADLALHAPLTTPSMGMLAYTALQEAGLTPAFGEMDLVDDKLLAVAGFVDGFFLVDISDPTKPRAVSFTPEPGAVADVKASDDGKVLFVATQMSAFTGIKAFDISVPERPIPVGAFPIASDLRGGCHMIAVFGDVIYCAPNDATVRIFSWARVGPAVTISPLSVYAPTGGAPEVPFVWGPSQEPVMTHDMTVQPDPLTGTPTMYVSFWDGGMHAVDVSDPANPTELGVWAGAGAEDWGTYDGNVHTSMAGLVDGRRIVVAVPEWAAAPSLTVIDATDYGNMTAIGHWAPHTAEELGGESRTFSTHNFQLVGDKAYMAMYHGGIWVLDLADPARPTPVGYHITSEPPAMPVGLPFFSGGPTVWDVVLKDGVLYATDITSGLHVLQYEGDVGAVGRTSFA